MAVGDATLPLSIRDLERTREPLERATMLPGAAFTDPHVLDWELESVFRGGWICVGHVDQVRERGDFLMAEIGRESAFVVADDNGRPHAFFNTCRHRGARIVDEPQGRLGRLQCPYHAWSYAFDGSLRNAPHTDEIEDFDKRCYGLKGVRTASSTRSTPTGRRSPRTTASACTARASIPSSTSSATTCRARRSRAPARGAAAR